MDTTQLDKAQKEWSHAMDIWLENNRIYVANDGYITDNPKDVKSGKHFGEYAGLYYYSKRAGNTNEIINVISAITA